MEIEVKDKIYNNQLAEQTKRLALKRASELQKLAEAGRFNSGERTADIEQEVFVLDRLTGGPINVESLLLNNTLGIRPDTTICTVEYDANGITPVTAEGIRNLFDSFQNKTRKIQQVIARATEERGLIVSTGTQPLIGKEYVQLIICDPEKRKRYSTLDEITYNQENQQKEMVIKNSETGEELRDRASNLSAMSRCAATQLHLAYPTIEETIEAYNITIAIAGPLVAMLSNSPYAAGIDTGLVSSRMEMLAQAEQRRAGLAKPANSVMEVYARALELCLPPFIETEDSRKALELAYGAMHISTRLRLDEEKGTSRIEMRMIDSLSPYRSIQALLISMGIIEDLRGRDLPIFSESQANYKNGRKGLKSVMLYLRKPVSTLDLVTELSESATRGLNKLGLGKLDLEFLTPLKEKLGSGITQADEIRSEVRRLETQGLSRNNAIALALKDLNTDMLKGE